MSECVAGGHSWWCRRMEQQACVTHSTSVLCAHCFEIAWVSPDERIVLEAFAQAVIDLHRALFENEETLTFDPTWGDRAYHAARAAVKAARMLTVKEEYR